jgi:hypothetical protein
MSMMVNSVSNVSFKSTSAPASDDFLSRPGAYSKDAQQNLDAHQSPAQAPKKKHSALKVIAGLVVAAALVAGSLFAAHKYKPEIFNASKEFAEFKELDFMPKAKGYVTTAIGKAGKAIEDAAILAKDNCIALWDKLFKKNPPASDAA